MGPKTAERLALAGLSTVGELLHLVPRRWEDLRQVVPVGQLVPGVAQRTCAVVVHKRVVFFGRRALEVRFLGDDGTQLSARWFHFRGGLSERFAVGARFFLDGTPRLYKGALQLVHPETTPVGEGGEVGGVVRVRYPEIEDVPGRVLEKLCGAVVERFVDRVPELLPSELLAARGWPTIAEALRILHRPPSTLTADEILALNEGRSPAQVRLAFEELLVWALAGRLRRTAIRRESGIAVLSMADADKLVAGLAELPFALTAAQRRALGQIAGDLTAPHPMHRLLSGDVGVGKTAVAWGACRLAVAGGHQAALMAPTELLAEQHARTLGPWAQASHMRLALLTASTAPVERRRIVDELARGRIDLVVGTHALLSEAVTFARLALVIVDEQHRFGVRQRAALRDKSARSPHLLVMTATPIPRTLALTLYGDLDLSVLDERLPGRVPPATELLVGKAGRKRAETMLHETLAAGERAYWVCPLVEEGTLDVADAVATHARLAQLVDGDVGLVHGRLPADERQRTVAAFRRGAIRVLVATSVVEVGVDVPEATLMVVDGAERFGLAQLHQLRGRVGRAAAQESRCVLLQTSRSGGDAAHARLSALVDSSDGFALAELDLLQRGPGELDGAQQTGAPLLRHADLSRQADLLADARRAADALLQDDPELAKHATLREALERRRVGGVGAAG